jgi:hypothetical protein
MIFKNIEKTVNNIKIVLNLYEKILSSFVYIYKLILHIILTNILIL